MTPIIEALTAVYTAWIIGRAAVEFRRGTATIAWIEAGQTALALPRTSAVADPGDVNVILLLPLLREQSTVSDLLRAIDRLEYATERVVVVPITSEKEAHEDALSGQVGRTTRDVLMTHLAAEPGRFRVLPLHVPSVDGNKASQMNMALDELAARGYFETPLRTYVGVYDADSRPPAASLRALALAARTDGAPAFQQYPIYLLEAGSRGLWMRMEAWLQTSRTVCVEIPRQRRVNDDLHRGRAAGRTFTYCIGHGEFLRSDWLMRMRFPEAPVIDDLPTGYMLSLARQRIVPLPVCDFCSVPPRVGVFVRQTATWFSAQLDHAGPLVRARDGFGPVPRLRAWRGRAEQMWANIHWAARGPVRVVALGGLGITGRWWGMAALVSAFAIEAAARWSMTHRLLERHVESRVLPRFAFDLRAIFRPWLKSAGPCLHLLRLLSRRPAAAYKTER
jgi:hypothetical protein